MTAEQIKRIRRRLDLSQSKLAKKIGVSVRTVQGWEIGRGQRKIYLDRIANLIPNEK